MMRFPLLCAILTLVPLGGCKRPVQAEPAAKAFGAAIVEVGGGKQAAGVGTTLEQPVVVQVNDAQGSPVAAAPVCIRTTGGATVEPAQGLTGADGQFSTTITLGAVPGGCQIAAITQDKVGKNVELHLQEIALGYEQILGRELSERYCARCHDPESTPERVSNHDNLKANAPAFTDGNKVNSVSEADLAAIIAHGGSAWNRSPEMPPFGFTLAKSDINALVAYICGVADPPCRSKGLVYAKN